MRQTFQTLGIARPSVAVIIPYFNGAKWIERAIKSVVNQTMPPDEFIVVNEARDGLAHPWRKHILQHSHELKAASSTS